MEFFLTLLPLQEFYIQWPLGFLGWILFLGEVGLVVWLALRWERYEKLPPPTYRYWMVGIIAVQLLFALFLGFRIQYQAALPSPGTLSPPAEPAVLIFSLVAVVLAAGFMGPITALFPAVVAGGAVMLINGYSVFTMPAYLLVALLFGYFLQQRYAGWLFRVLRQPFAAALLIGVIYSGFWGIHTLFSTAASLPIRLEYIFSIYREHALAFLVVILVAGAIGEIAAYGFGDHWAEKAALVPAPYQRSIYLRTLYILVPAIIGAFLILMITSWRIASASARQLITSRLESSAVLASNTIPLLLETGHNLASKYAADVRLRGENSQEWELALEDSLQFSSFFQETMLVALGPTPVVMALRSTSSLSGDFLLAEEELVGLRLAEAGVPVQYYATPSLRQGETIQLSFIALVNPGEGVARALIARTVLQENPIFSLVLDAIAPLNDIDGYGFLADEFNQVVYSSQGDNLLLEEYRSEPCIVPENLEMPSNLGGVDLLFCQPAVGRSWTVYTAVSSLGLRSQALEIVTPFWLLLMILSLVVLISLFFLLRSITFSLEELATDASRIARDQAELATPLKQGGEDEVGRLRRAFERLRVSLKSRLDEQEQYLLVSRAVASSLEMESAIIPALKASLSSGAASARVALVETEVPLSTRRTANRVGIGQHTREYEKLDPQIIPLVGDQPRLVLTNPVRTRLLSFEGVTAIPQAIIAFPLKHENRFYGVFWVSYTIPHQFAEDEMRFLATLAGQIALAVANAILFRNAEIGRRRLEAILQATPDPVWVTDRDNRLLLANPSAWKTLNHDPRSGIGRELNELLSNPTITNLVASCTNNPVSTEVDFDANKTYFATVTPVISDDVMVGRVCVLRDISHYKQLDKQKSEFVRLVSHDLRSPLTVIGGHLTMIEMHGRLDPEQKLLIQKMRTGVQRMTRMVNDLLDLGRIGIGAGLRIDKINVETILSQLLENLQQMAAQKKINLDIKMPPTPLIVEADPALLAQAFMNLVENAIKYTQYNGNVWVALQNNPVDGKVLFSVKDDGIGIPPLDLERIFEPFFRVANRETRSQQGTGLGLSLVKSIAEQHKGKAWAESKVGQGSSFYFEIPRTQPRLVE